jgi:Xaa-Pro aminopeptidase
MADRRPERLAALTDALTANHLDGLLLSGLPNIRYITGFSGSNALALVTTREIHLITDFRYKTQVADEVGDLAAVVIEPQSLWTGLWRIMGSLQQLDVVGFESSHLLHRDFQRLLDAGSRWQWRATTDLVETLRERKDADELALITAAAAVCDRALGAALPQFAAGMTELQIAGVLEKMLRDEGSEGFPFPSIVASGPRAALPHARSSRKVVERGELLLLDFGAEVGGYCADMTRTVVMGRATDEQLEIHAIVRGANELASSGVRPGMRGRDADAIARSYIERQGYGEAFGHSLGHGLGLEVHEAPRLAKTADAPLLLNSVLTIEPGIYRAGWGGIRIEDDVHLGPSGPEILTHFSRELAEVA